jgi:hypothetical protein
MTVLGPQVATPTGQHVISRVSLTKWNSGAHAYQRSPDPGRAFKALRSFLFRVFCSIASVEANF